LKRVNDAVDCLISEQLISDLVGELDAGHPRYQ
jgi:hypothetical protein